MSLHLWGESSMGPEVAWAAVHGEDQPQNGAWASCPFGAVTSVTMVNPFVAFATIEIRCEGGFSSPLSEFVLNACVGGQGGRTSVASSMYLQRPLFGLLSAENHPQPVDVG